MIGGKLPIGGIKGGVPIVAGGAYPGGGILGMPES